MSYRGESFGVAFALFLFGGLIAFSAGCDRAGKAEPERTIHKQKKDPHEVVLPVSEQVNGTVEVAVVSTTDGPELLQAPGKITLTDQGYWRIGVLTSGRIEKVYVNLGDSVREGQLLAAMHSHDVHEARAAYQTARSDLARAEAAVALAQQNYDRAERLYGLRAGSLAEVQRAKQEVLNAQTTVRNEQVELERERVHLEGNLGVIADPGPEVREDEADRIPVRAAGTGYILAKNVTPGTVVDPTKDLFVIGDLKRLWMIASVGETKLAKLRTGLKASVTTRAFPSEAFRGVVTNLGPELDPVTRVMHVRIAIDNPSIRLRPEMLANAQIEVGGSRSVLLVPDEAVQQINDQDIVFIQKTKDRFEVRPVRLGDRLNGRIAILEGIQSGEPVVTHGGFLLKSQLLKASIESE